VLVTTIRHTARNGNSIKSENQRTLLLTLLRHQPISRIRLSRRTGISSTTVTNLTAPLVQAGIVSEVGPDLLAITAGAGRPPLALALVPDSRYALGIHIGVRKSQIALGTLEAQLIDQCVVAHHQGESPQQVLERLAQAARQLAAENGLALDSGRIIGVGVGASGLVDNEHGINIWAPSLNWHDVPIARNLSTLGLQVVVENNVRSMALAESLFGGGQGRRVLAFVYARMGVGAGLVIDGHIYRGSRHAAGEIGHWTLLPKDGEICRCGNRGCLETLISEAVLVAEGGRLAPEILTDADPLEALFTAARSGHQSLQKMLSERAEYLGIALANLVNVINPEVILLGGLLYQGYDLFQPVVEATMRQRSFKGIGLQEEMRPATFGMDAGAVGAVTLALDTFFYSGSPDLKQNRMIRTGKSNE
jgi:predicted NBD/HSP70 family sugar kinase